MLAASIILFVLGGVEGTCTSGRAAASAFVGVSNHPSRTFCFCFCLRRSGHHGPDHQLRMAHAPVDDDDVSQHEFMSAGQNQTSLVEQATADDDTPVNTRGGGGGYRRIEDWHDNHVKENPEEHQVLTHLKREKARWGKTFESLGGDGI